MYTVRDWRSPRVRRSQMNRSQSRISMCPKNLACSNWAGYILVGSLDVPKDSTKENDGKCLALESVQQSSQSSKNNRNNLNDDSDDEDQGAMRSSRCLSGHHLTSGQVIFILSLSDCWCRVTIGTQQDSEVHIAASLALWASASLSIRSISCCDKRPG